MISNWVKPTVAAKIAVIAPTTVMISSDSGAYSSIGDRRQIMKTPAVTMVAAWIRADTGVGPSIASGSQVCRPSWADLPIAPMNSRMPATSSAGIAVPRKLISVPAALAELAKITSNSIEPKIW